MISGYFCPFREQSKSCCDLFAAFQAQVAIQAR